MLSQEQIAENKNKFLELLDSLDVDVSALIAYLETTDFFVAPASTKYHAAYEGGLCEHSLQVYYNMKALISAFNATDNLVLNDDSVKIVALLHDISKVNSYEVYSKNEKVYSENGKKQDNLGYFDWVTSLNYKVKDSADRFVCVDHDVNSAYIVSRFLTLSTEEFAAIANHSGGMTNKFSNNDLNEIFKRFPLALFLHQADMMACYYQNI